MTRRADRLLALLELLRGRPVSFDPAASTAGQVEAVIAAVATGTVPVDLGRQIIESIKMLADVRPVEELEARIITLEAKQI